MTVSVSRMFGNLVVVTAVVLSCSGCVLTKVVSVPLRVGGAVISVVPVAGNPAHDGIDRAADALDKIPL